ncbi:hypothetical protein WMZ97_20935 [Lentibacillus sp. N15]|uniref:hypothetical protein n=1 Tax=Lentibacillus songyuanensis TaxID=3136161 RepID=UPI0031BA8FCC
MKQTIRSFSIGLLTASLLALLVLLFVNDNNHDTADIANEDMIQALQEDGYRIVSESDYIALTVNEKKDKKEAKEVAEAEKTEQTRSDKQEKNDDNEKADENKKADQDKNKEQDKDKKKEEKTYTLTIKSGMASSEISDDLKANGIIDDAGKFSKFLKDNDYDQRVQLGKFKVKSSMNQQELAQKITR